MMPIGVAIDRNGTPCPAKDWLYQIRTRGETVHVRLLRRGLGWDAEVVQTENSPKQVSVSVRECDQVNGLAYTAELEISVGKQGAETVILMPEDRIARSSLTQAATVSFLPDSGYYPTFFLPMLGTVASGKSCFACAAQTKAVAQQMRELLPFGYETIHTLQQQPRLAPTELGRVSQYPFNILDKKGEIRALCYLVDISGETTVDRRRGRALEGMLTEDSIGGDLADEQTANRILKQILRLSDGLLVFVDQRGFQPGARVRGDVQLLLQRLRRQKKLPKTICLICTHADALQKLLRESPDKLDLGGARLCPDSLVFSEATSAEDPREAMNKHLAIAAQVCGPLLDPALPMGGFLVQSVEATGETDPVTGERLLDFSKGKNVALPLAYVFEQLIRIV